jgi:2-iminobutanoate/2-iminopropanoate deaminase
MTTYYEKEVIVSEKAPKALGPYSAGIRVGQFIFCAGQTGIVRTTGELVPGGIEAETRQVLINLQNVLESAGAKLKYVVKTTVFLRDMNDFTRMNAIYGEFFNDEPPARTTVAVAGLPKGAAVEIEAIVVIPQTNGD